MRRKTRNTIFEIALGAALGAGIMASFLFFGLRARAAGAEPFDDLRCIPRAEIRELRAAEDWEAPEPPAPAYSQSDLDLLAAIIYAEAGDQVRYGTDALRLVGDVIMNRVHSPAWPDTVSGVVYQPGQFSPVTDGGLDRAWGRVTPECYEAAARALSGDQIDTNIIYFSMGYCANGVFAFQYGDHFFGY